ncbi:MAG TPA: hypothetical protein PK323_09620 [Bacteroidia bacterium]|nr:hypothetical protein [Bacteroidia bacterium]
MKRFIKSLLFFIPVVCFAYILLICVWGEFMPGIFKKNLNYFRAGSYGGMMSRLEEVKTVKNVDILFLGSSHTYRGFDNRIFKKAGFQTFNLGSSAQSPMQTLLLLNRYLDQLNPKTIIYEVYPNSFTSDGIESSLDIIANDKNDFGSIQMALKQNHIKIYNSLIYGFYRDFFNRNKGEKEKKKNGNDTYINGGFLQKDLSYFKHIKYPNNTWNLNGKQWSYFEKILELIKKKNINLILVQTPITPNLYHSFNNNQAFDLKMKSYGTYYNFNDIVSLDDSLHFYDPHHLNQNGVIIFNEKLIEKLFTIKH